MSAQPVIYSGTLRGGHVGVDEGDATRGDRVVLVLVHRRRPAVAAARAKHRSTIATPHTLGAVVDQLEPMGERSAPRAAGIRRPPVAAMVSRQQAAARAAARAAGLAPHPPMLLP